MDDAAFDAQALALVRRAYARQLLALGGIQDDPALERSFAAVERERFLGPPPWQFRSPSGSARKVAGTDPVVVYQDVLFALDPERGVNNGQPSLHAAWLHRARLKPAQRVAHIGAGTGYYTAVIAELVGPEGHVAAIEFDPRLAAMAAENLAAYRQVEVVQGDGIAWPREPVDCVYVNFSVERPADAWIDNLAPGGRLIFPLGVPRPQPSPGRGRHAQHGAGLLVRRIAGGFAASWLGPAFFVWAEGATAERPHDRAAMAASFANGGVEFVRRLRWREPADPGRSWFIGADWSLGYDEPAGA